MPAHVPDFDDSCLAEERRAVEACKKVGVMLFGLAMEAYGAALSEQQEVMMYIADTLIDVYGAESAVLRAVAAAERNAPRALRHQDAARIILNDATLRIEAVARQALAAMADGDTLQTLVAALRRVLKVRPVNTVTLRRQIADEAVARGEYFF